MDAEMLDEMGDEMGMMEVTFVTSGAFSLESRMRLLCFTVCYVLQRWRVIMVR